MQINKKEILNEQRGASILEVLLAIGLVALMVPFTYGYISETSQEIRDVAIAKQIINVRGAALNFVRMHQDDWPDFAQIRLSEEELASMSEFAHVGFIDKYPIQDAATADIYLAFTIEKGALRAAKIAKAIGNDAAVADSDGVAYSDSWAVGAPDFKPGDLIYRISRSFSNTDNSKYLHRGTSGEDELNIMQRPLNMGKFDIRDIGTIAAESSKFTEAYVSFLDTTNAVATNVYFSGGANMDGNTSKIGSLRVNGDITGFRNINTARLNGNTYSMSGNIITNRALINRSVNVGKNLTIKSDSARTITGFNSATAHSVSVPYIFAGDMLFHNNFGITVSSELLMGNVAPIRLGSWSFPSLTPPRFSEFKLSRGKTPTQPNVAEFEKIINSGWKDIKSKTELP